MAPTATFRGIFYDTLLSGWLTAIVLLKSIVTALLPLPQPYEIINNRRMNPKAIVHIELVTTM
jgi:hypothetical protein